MGKHCEGNTARKAWEASAEVAVKMFVFCAADAECGTLDVIQGGGIPSLLRDQPNIRGPLHF
jgi:hypothetical protein